MRAKENFNVPHCTALLQCTKMLGFSFELSATSFTTAVYMGALFG